VTPIPQTVVNTLLQYEGLPPLDANRTTSDLVVFINVASFWGSRSGHVQKLFTTTDASGIIAVERGHVVCVGTGNICVEHTLRPHAELVDLAGGALTPALVSVGTSLGLQEIAMEESTTDGVVYDSLMRPVPKVLGGDRTLIRAVDGLQFGTRDAL
jgi:imidazolonepropionase-like amidohydrolase